MILKNANINIRDYSLKIAKNYLDSVYEKNKKVKTCKKTCLTWNFTFGNIIGISRLKHTRS